MTDPKLVMPVFDRGFRSPTPEERADQVERQVKAERNGFERGFAIAVSMMLRGCDEKECLGAAGLMDPAHVEQLGLDDFDLGPLRRFFARDLG